MFKWFLFIVCMTVLVIPVNGQSDSVRDNRIYVRGEDSLKAGKIKGGIALFMEVVNFYQAAGNKEREADAWYRMGDAVRKFAADDHTDLLFAFGKALPLFRNIKGKEVTVAAIMYRIADEHLAFGSLEQAEAELLAILDYYRSYPSITFRLMPFIYYELSRVNRYRGELNKALFYSLQCLKKNDEQGATHWNDIYFGELAEVYEDLGQAEKSAEWYKKTLALRDQAGADALNLFRTAAFLSQELILLHREQEALDYVLGLAKRHQPINDEQRAAKGQALGYCYEALHQYGLAEKYYQEMVIGYGYNRVFPGDEVLMVALLDIGKFYVSRHQYKKAAPYLMTAIKAPPNVTTQARFRDLHAMLFQVDSAAGDYLSAIRHFSEYKALNDSIFTEKKSKQIAELEIQYETQQKDKDILLKQQNIQLLTKQGQLEHTDLLRANLIRNVTLGGIVLLLIIVSLLFSRYRLKQKSNAALEASQVEIQVKNSSLENLVREKEWLLKEIHHRVKNNLQIIMSLLNSQSVYLENDAALFAIRDSQHRVQAISLIHQKLYQSENVAAINMPVYVRDLVEYLKDSFTTGQTIRFELNIDEAEMDVAQAVPMGLILNEAITNSIKYAFPGGRIGKIRIVLRREDVHQYLLSIADDGIGIRADIHTEATTSLGMSLMKGLSEEIGGHFAIENNNGTLITIAFVNDHMVNNL